MLRENLFNTKHNMGVDIRSEDNEKAFIITPLANAAPVKVTTNLQEIMNRQHLPDPEKSSIVYSHGRASPSPQGPTPPIQDLKQASDSQ